jgi:hypothetical protein
MWKISFLGFDCGFLYHNYSTNQEIFHYLFCLANTYFTLFVRNCFLRNLSFLFVRMCRDDGVAVSIDDESIAFEYVLALRLNQAHERDGGRVRSPRRGSCVVSWPLLIILCDVIFLLIVVGVVHALHEDLSIVNLVGQSGLYQGLYPRGACDAFSHCRQGVFLVNKAPINAELQILF